MNAFLPFVICDFQCFCYLRSCIPVLDLQEKTSCMNRSMLAEEHLNRLSDYRHVRYMHIPFTDHVVTVCSNPTSPSNARSIGSVPSVGSAISQYFMHDSYRPTELPTQGMLDLLLKNQKEVGVSGGEGKNDSVASEIADRGNKTYKGIPIEKFSVADLRSELLELGPLDLDV